MAGASGYIGMQCAALVTDHPEVTLTQLSSRRHVGRRHCDVAPASAATTVLTPDIDAAEVDVILSCLPHTVAAPRVDAWLEAGATVIDLSADFRLTDGDVYRRWYDAEHPAPSLLGTAVYALPELVRSDLTAARLLAMPGCYATAVLLACAPAIGSGLVSPQVVVDAKSGISGAGRSPSLTSHFAEANESVRPYAITGHRHTAEILQFLSGLAAAELELTFVPHLVPMTRGILVTAYLRPLQGAGAELRDLYRAFCDQHPFLTYQDEPPATKQVLGTNHAVLSVTEQGRVAVITCAIDNLVRGAAGQAVQVLNHRFGFPETTGLDARPWWP